MDTKTEETYSPTLTQSGKEEVVVNRKSRRAGKTTGKREPIRNARPTVRGNAPCPCGSGDKFKRCHRLIAAGYVPASYDQ